MNSEDFWASVSKIVEEGFTPEGLKQLDHYAELFINGRRSNSMAAQREVQRMSLHPYSREQKIRQIESLHEQSMISKENSNKERNKLHA